MLRQVTNSRNYYVEGQYDPALSARCTLIPNQPRLKALKVALIMAAVSGIEAHKINPNDASPLVASRELVAASRELKAEMASAANPNVNGRTCPATMDRDEAFLVILVGLCPSNGEMK